MRTVKNLALIILFSAILVITGCVSQDRYEELQLRNDAQRERISELESRVESLQLELDQANRRLEAARDRSGVEAQALEQKVAALEESLRNKEELVEQLQDQLMHGTIALPAELDTRLMELADRAEMVTYDPDRGVVRFESDLLFDPGSAELTSDAEEAVRSLAEILRSDEALQFDAIIAGHTDDMPIARPETRRNHPTNWHLSAHRAISVLQELSDNDVDAERMSVRGFSEYRPVADNEPGRGGNPKNRRVEIYIVPEGM